MTEIGNVECVGNRRMAFRSLLVIQGFACYPAIAFLYFPFCFACRQCSARSAEQAQGEGGERAQGENHGAKWDRRERSSVGKYRERSGQANYAVSGQSAKQAENH